MTVLLAAGAPVGKQQQTAPPFSPVQSLVNQYCVDCHDTDKKKGDLNFDSISLEDLTQHPDIWEKVVRKLRARQMPPVGKKRPGEREYDAVVSRLTALLDIGSAR